MPNGEKSQAELLFERWTQRQRKDEPLGQYPFFEAGVTTEKEADKEGWWNWLIRHMPWTITATALKRAEPKLLAEREQYRELWGKIPFAKEMPPITPEIKKAAAEYTPRFIPTPEEYREFEQLPLGEQLLYESPFWAAAMGVSAVVPAATAIQARLAPIIARGGARGIAASAAAKGLIPVAKVEQAQAWLINKAFTALKRIKIEKLLKAMPEYKLLVKDPKLSPLAKKDVESMLRNALLLKIQGNTGASLAQLEYVWGQYPQLAGIKEAPFWVYTVPAVAGGVPAEIGLLPQVVGMWDALAMPQRGVLVKALGLDKAVAKMSWAEIPVATRAILGIRPTPETLPGVEPEVYAPISPEVIKRIEELVGRELEAGELDTILREQQRAGLTLEDTLRQMGYIAEVAEAPLEPPKPPAPPKVVAKEWQDKGVDAITKALGISGAQAVRIWDAMTPAQQLKLAGELEAPKEVIEGATPEELSKALPLPPRISDAELTEEVFKAQNEIAQELLVGFGGQEAVPPSILKARAGTVDNIFGLEFKLPTAIKYITSQTYYANVLGVKPLVEPLEIARGKLDQVNNAIVKAIEKKIIAINKEGASLWERMTSVIKNVPTKAVAGMRDKLDTFEEPPADLTPKQKELFTWIRNLTRTTIAAENQVRALLGMEPIEYRQAYIRHIADDTAMEIMSGRQDLPPKLEYWSRKILAKKIFNPMALQRELAVDLEKLFTKDLGFALKSMVRTALREIYLTQPLKIFNKQIRDLADEMPASLRKWTEDYIRHVILSQQTETDAGIERLFRASGLAGIFNDLLRPFGRTLGQKPFTHLVYILGRSVILSTVGLRAPLLIIRNLHQHTQNLAFHGVTATLKALMPAPPACQELLKESLFLTMYSGFEDLPIGVMAKVERLGLYPYGKSAVFNARQAMKATWWWSNKFFEDPKYGVDGQNLGWVDPQRTYKEPYGFRYASERRLQLAVMEFYAGCSQYQYIGMGMPEIFRQKTFVPMTRLQSWWMNYYAKFLREALHMAITGEVRLAGVVPPQPPKPPRPIGEPIPPKSLPPRYPKVDWKSRLNLWKYIILGGATLTAMGYKRSFLTGALPHWFPPPVQVSIAAYNYVSAKNETERQRALTQLRWSWSGLVPGAVGAQEFTDVWTGEKPIERLFFYEDELPPHMPTWGLPPLEAKEARGEGIRKAQEEITGFEAQLGQIVEVTKPKLIPVPGERVKAEVTTREPYQMPDFLRDVNTSLGKVPAYAFTGITIIPKGVKPQEITQTAGYSPKTELIGQAELVWATYYDWLQGDQKGDFRRQDTSEAAWTEAYLFLFGKVSALQNKNSWAVLQLVMAQYGIPANAIPNYERELQKQTGIGGVPIEPTGEALFESWTGGK